MWNSCERIWINVHLATLDPAVDDRYGSLLNQAIGVCDGRIVAIGAMTSLPDNSLPDNSLSAEIIDGAGRWLTPGLIDAHTHLVFAGNRAEEFEQRLLGASYETIARSGGGIQSTVNATRKASVAELVALAEPRLRALLAEGVTTVEIKSGYGLELTTELNMLRAAKQLQQRYPVRVSTTLLGAHALPPEFKDDADGYIDWVCAELIPAAAHEGLADAVDLFCETLAFTPAQSERVFIAAQQQGLGIKAHVEQLSNQQGAALAARYGAWSADHLEFLDECGVIAMAKAGTVATLCPGAFYCLRQTQLPPIELLRQHRVPMAVATDLNPGSAPIASLQLAMHMACTLFRLTPAEALAGTTRNAAQALNLGDRLGQLKVGMLADMALWDIEHPAELAYQFGVNPLVQRIVAGEISYA
ncbi:MAG: imidazolonepropionase [Motiliproteus sp.]